MIPYSLILISYDYYFSALRDIGPLYLYKRDYAKAQSVFKRLVVCKLKSQRSIARTSLALIPLLQGKLNRTLELLDAGIAADEIEQAWHGDDGDMAHKHMIRALIHLERGETDLAVVEARKYVDATGRIESQAAADFTYIPVVLLAAAGHLTEATEIVQEMRTAASTDAESDSAVLHIAEGALAFYKGDSYGAIQRLQQLGDSPENFVTRCILAQAYLKVGQADEAISNLEPISSDWGVWHSYWGIWRTKVHYWLGQALEMAGQNQKAEVQYARFLELWEAADHQPESIIDARTRLNRLRQSS